MNLWEQYNAEHTLGTVLGEITDLPLWQCSDKALFEALKRHLTRRELRCFVMNEAGLSDTEISAEAGLPSAEEMQKVLMKARKKLRRPKMQQEFRALLYIPEDGESVD